MSRPRLTPVMASELPAKAFRTGRRIRFSDCDPAGIAYTGRIIDLMNGALEDIFRERLGLDYYGMIRDRIGLGYGRTDCDFFAPLTMGSEVSITVLVERIGGASVTWRLHLHVDGQEAARGELVMVTTSLVSNSVMRLPDGLRSALTTYETDCA